jgi:hypothetical protein
MVTSEGFTLTLAGGDSLADIAPAFRTNPREWVPRKVGGVAFKWGLDLGFELVMRKMKTQMW